MAKTSPLLENQLGSDLDQEIPIQRTSIDAGTSPQRRTKTVHITLQGKGGIGKSFVSLVLAQYIKQQDPNVLCIDTDPVNATFSSFPGLGAHSINLLENNVINERRFDGMMEQILNADGNVVIDNGAASYVPLSSYLIDNDAFAVIRNAGKHVIVHSVIAGGLAQANTVSDFATLASQLPEGIDIVVWLNEHFGEIEAAGKTFLEMKAYLDNKHRVIAVIELPHRTGSTFARDIDIMLKCRLTFDEALNSDRFFIMPKQRITMVRRAIYEQLDAAL